jgi:hypothetical protein
VVSDFGHDLLLLDAIRNHHWWGFQKSATFVGTVTIGGGV